jgi:gluconate 5-dehydrogenase
MSGALAGKTALISGSTRGIGRAIAQAMAQAGATVVVHGRSPEAARAVAQELHAQGHAAQAVGADLSDPQGAIALFEQALALAGQIDILVNNAGISPIVGRPENLTLDHWQRILSTNLTAPFLLCQAAGRHWIARGLPGCVVNVASVGGQVALPGQVGYCVSKAGLIALTRQLAVDWAKHAIRVNGLAPAYIVTDLTEGVRESPRYAELILRQTPLGRLGEAGEVALAAVFLASEAASYITGQTLGVDGGWTAI